MSNYTFDSDSLKYLLNKLKEKFALKSEADLKVDKVNGKDLVTNDYTDSHIQMNQNALNNVSISNKTDTEIQLTLKSNNENNIITIPYDKHKKSALFVDCKENFDCYNGIEYPIYYRYASTIREGTHKLTAEILRNNEVIKNETDISDYYLHIPNLNDTEIRMYATDSEGTKTGITYLKLNVKPVEPIVVYTTTNTAIRPRQIIGATNGYTAEVNGNQVTLFKNNSNDVVTCVNFYNTNGLTNVSYMTSSTTNMSCAYQNCKDLTGSPVCGHKVTDMSYAYRGCINLTGNPAYGPNVTNMYYTYYQCFNLTGRPLCGNKVTNMVSAYQACRSLTGRPVCGDKVTNMSMTYQACRNLTGSPVCGNNVTNMYYTYQYCYNLTGSPVCGNNVTDMCYTYHNCYNLTGSPVCGNNVTNMYSTYENCYNLTGSPVCGPNVTDMYNTYADCPKLTGQPVCGDNVINMSGTYSNCTNLTGSPVCGPNVTNMFGAYYGCYNLTGNPVCGPNVTDMSQAYHNCTGLETAVCGPNVTSISWAYAGCNIIGNMYVYSNKVYHAPYCFNGRDNSNMLNIYVPKIGCNSYYNTLNTFLNTNSGDSITGQSVTWTNDATNNRYYNTAQNIYIYPVANVEQAYKNNG